jgi:hypothetical protein
MPGAVVPWICVCVGFSPMAPGRYFILFWCICVGMDDSVYSDCKYDHIHLFSINFVLSAVIVNYYIMCC